MAMRSILSTILALAALGQAGTAAAQTTGRWTVDQAYAVIDFQTRHDGRFVIRFQVGQTTTTRADVMTAWAAVREAPPLAHHPQSPEGLAGAVGGHVARRLPLAKRHLAVAR